MTGRFPRWPCLCYVGGMARTATRSRCRDATPRTAAAGFTLTELLVVVRAHRRRHRRSAIPVTMEMVNRAKNDSASVVVAHTFIDGARDRAVAERRNIELTFQPPNRMLAATRSRCPRGPRPMVGEMQPRGRPGVPDAYAGIARHARRLRRRRRGHRLHRRRAGDVHQRRLAHRLGRRRHQRHGLLGRARTNPRRPGRSRLRRHRHAPHLEMERRVMDAVTRSRPGRGAPGRRARLLVRRGHRRDVHPHRRPAAAGRRCSPWACSG